MLEQQIRTKKGVKTIKIKNRNHAIQLFCFECMGFRGNEIMYCTDNKCPLFQFRMGYSTPKYLQILPKLTSKDKKTCSESQSK